MRLEPCPADSFEIGFDESVMSRPALSIVIPVYNCSRYVQATLESISQQTFTDFEIIVVDDGSVDGTAEILRSYSKHEPRLTVVTLAHRGVVVALNTGIAKARSDLIVRIDADDLMAPSRLDRQLAFMADHPELGAAGSYYRIIDEHGEVRGSHEPPFCSQEDVELFISSGGNPIFPAPSMILRKSVVQAVGGFREEFRQTEDVDLSMRIIQSGFHILVQPEYLTYFRYHSGSTSANNTRAQYFQNKLIYENFRRHRAGQAELSPASYNDSLRRLTFFGKLRSEVGVMSAILMRRRDMALLRGQRLGAVLFLAGAAILNPGATARKVKRKVAFLRARQRDLGRMTMTNERMEVERSNSTQRGGATESGS